ncbi:hypothetical protein YC2023_066349 [Brassica napus]
MLALPVDCLGDFGPGGLSVQYTQDVRGCPPAHTGRLWLSVSTHRMSVAVRVCLCVSVSTHMTYVAVLQYTYQHVGCLFSTHRTSVGVHQHTQDVRECPSTHKGRPGLSMCVHQHTERLWLSISTHITTLVLGVSTLTLTVDCSGDFSPRGVSGQYIQDVRGCLPAHTGRPWLSVCVSVCLSLSVCTHKTSVAVHQYTYQHYTQDIRGCLPAHTGHLWLSVAVRQHTQDVCSCPSANRGRLWLSMCVCVCLWVSASIHKDVRGCLWLSVSTYKTSVCVRQHTQDVRVYPSAHTGRPWLSISTHISMMALPVDCSGDFGPRGLCVQYTQDVCGCPSAHTGRLKVSVSTQRTSMAVRLCLCDSVSTHRTSVAVHQYTYQHYTQDICGCPSAHTRRPCVSVSTHRTFGAVRVCPSAHTGRLWLSISTHISTLVLGLSTLTLPVDCSGNYRPRGLSGQYTQDVRGCPPAHTGPPWLSVTHRTSVAVHQYTYQHAGPWTQHAGPSRGLFGTSVGVRQHTHDVRGCPTHIRPLVLGLSMLALPVDCLGDFGPRGLSVQYIQDVYGCLPAHTGHLWLSVAVRQHTQDVRGCPCVSVCVRQHTHDFCGCPSVQISARWSLDSARLPFPWIVRVILAHVGCLFSTHRTSVGVHQHTQDVRECPSTHTGRPGLSVCVRQHTERLWLSISTHISTLVLGLSTLTLPVDCSGDLIPCGLSGQYTQDVCGCLPAHTGCPWLSVCVSVCLSVSVCTQKTSVAVHQYTYQHVGPWTQHAGPSRGLFRTSVAVRGSPSAYTGHPIHKDVRGCLWLSVSTCKTSVCVRQHTKDVRVCPCVSVSTHMTSVELEHLERPSRQEFLCHAEPRPRSHDPGQDVRGCPSAHTGRPCVSVSKHMTSVAVHVCLCVSVCVRQHTQDVRNCLSVHISAHGLSILALPVDCLGDFGPHGLSGQYTQDVCGCSPAHTGRLWLSVAVRQHTQDVRGCHTFVLGLSTLTLPVDCSGDFGPRRLSIQYTQDVCGCPSAHTRRPTHITTLVLGLSTLTLPVDCSVDFSPRGLSGQYIQDVRGCLPAHTGRLWLSVCVSVCLSVSVCTHMTSSVQYTQDICGCLPAHTRHLWLSVAVRQHTHDVRSCLSEHRGRPWLSMCVCVCLWVSASIHKDVRGCLWLSVSTYKTSVCVRQHTQDVRVCPCVSVSTHRTSVAVQQYTYQHAGPSRGLFGTSEGVRQHTEDVYGCPFVSVTLTLPVDCSGDFRPRGLSVKYTQDVRGCPPSHTGPLWLLVYVSVCLSVSVSTHRTSGTVHVCPSAHRTSVVVHQYTYQHVGPWTQHVDPSRGLFGVCLSVSVSTHKTSVAVHLYTYQHYTQDVRGCPPAHTGHLWLSVAVCQHTQDVRSCPSAHTGRLWLSVCVCGCLPAYTRTFVAAVAVHQHIQDVCVCPSAHTERPCGSISTHRTSVAVHHTHVQDVCGCPPAHTGRPKVSVSTQRMSMAVRLCPCMSVSTHRTSVAVHQYTYQHVGPWTQHADPSRGLFGCFRPHGLSVQYTQDVRGCPPSHIGPLWLLVYVSVCLSVSVSTHRTSGTVHVCPSAHRTSVVVHQYTYQHVGPWTQHVDPSCGLFGVCLSVSVSTHKTSVAVHLYTYQHYTQDVRGCPPAHTGHLWLSVAVCQHTQDVRSCPSAQTGRLWLSVCVCGCLPAYTRTFVAAVAVHQHIQDVCVCPSAHTGRPCVSISTHKTSVAVHQYTYQHGGPWTQHAGPSRGLFGTSVGVRQHTKDVYGCPCVSVSTQRTSVAVHQYTYQHVGPWTQHVDPSCGLFGTSVAVRVCQCVSVCVRQHTQDVRGCPSVHISARCTHRTSVGVRQHTQDICGCLWLSVSTHRTSVAVRQHTQDVCGCPCVSVGVCQHTQGRSWLLWLSISTYKTSVCVRQHTQDVRVCPSAHTRRLWLSINTHISTVVLGLSTLALPVDCSGRPWVSVSTQRTSMAVRVCPSAHRGRPWLSISTHISTLVLGLSMLALPVDCLGDFGPRGLSVQYIQDVRGCPPVHTGHLWLSVAVRQHTQRTSVAVRVCLCVSVSTHMTSVAVHQYTYQHVGPWTQHADPSRGLFG